MNRRLVAGAALSVAFALAALPGAAQVAPFGMEEEREAIGLPATPEPPAPDAIGGLRGQIVVGAPAGETRALSALDIAEPVMPHLRPILPFADLTLSGEADARTWAIFLTEAEATSAATLHLGFINAIFVAPELSTLRVTINDYEVLATSLANAERVGTETAGIPVGLLHAGANRIRFEVVQRHRTDCTLNSTYELWTMVDPETTYLAFDDSASGRITQFTDLAAIGVDAFGDTIVNVIVPAYDQPAAASALLRLTQGLALQLQTPSQLIRVSAADPAEIGPGVLTVVLGTSEDIAEIIGRAPPRSGAAFLADTRGPVLVVSGQSWTEIAASVESLVDPLERDYAGQSIINTAAWHVPNVPVASGGASFTLAALGVPTTEFSGRRYRTSFEVAMPYDLYAQAYGNASLFLDAAYAPSVLPGSQVDIYVNGAIAATTPITSRGGGIFRHLEIEVPLRNFHPGINEVAIEAIVVTAADAACLPGATGTNANRFVLFDTTEFSVPSFGRAAQLPDLSALAGTGFPLATETEPLAVVLGRADGETLSAAATLTSKLTRLAGRPFAITATTGGSVRFGLFVGAVSQIPAAIADQAGIDETARSTWRQSEIAGADALIAAPGASDTGATFERWRDALAGGGGWQGQVSAFQDWLRRTFDFSFSSLWFGGARTLDYEPPADAGLVLAQGPLAGAQTSWTVLAAPTAAALQANMEALAAPDRWRQIEGQLVSYRPLTGIVSVVPLPGADLVLTSGQSPNNLRLVATNWLSKNLVVYGGLLLALCILLGISTQWLLNSIGRHG